MNNPLTAEDMIESYAEKYWMYVIHIPTSCFHPVMHGVSLYDVHRNMLDIYGANVQMVDFYMNDDAAETFKWLVEIRKMKLQEVENLQSENG